MQKYRSALKALFFGGSLLVLVGCASAPQSPDVFELNEGRYGHAAAADDTAIYVFGGSTRGGFHSTIERIDPTTRRSEMLPVTLIPRRYASAVWDGEESIYIFGGVTTSRGNYEAVPVVEVFNTRTGEVSRQGMNDPRRFNSATMLDGRFYVVGGSEVINSEDEQQLRPTSIVSVYDYQAGRMRYKSELPDARDTQVFVYNDQVCAIGGYDGEQVYARFDCLDPDSNTWHNMPDAPTGVSAHSVAVHNDTLYVFGDYANLDQVLAFNFTNSTWRRVDVPYQEGRHTASVMFGDEVFVIGGTASGQGIGSRAVQVFNVGEL